MRVLLKEAASCPLHQRTREETKDNQLLDAVGHCTSNGEDDKHHVAHHVHWKTAIDLTRRTDDQGSHCEAKDVDLDIVSESLPQLYHPVRTETTSSGIAEAVLLKSRRTSGTPGANMLEARGVRKVRTMISKVLANLALPVQFIGLFES